MEDRDIAAYFIYVQRESLVSTIRYHELDRILAMVKLLLICLILPLCGSCHHRDIEDDYPPLYIPELHDDEFIILTTDDEKELEKFGIVYDMKMNEKEG